MAVEKARVIARIKAKFPKLNLTQTRIDAIADRLSARPADDADDAAIDEVVDDFNELMPLADIAKEDDRVRNLEKKANAKKTVKKKATETPANTGSDEDEDLDLGDDVPSWAKQLLKTNKELSQKVNELETGKQTESRLSQATKAFESSKLLSKMKPEIKDKWIKRFDLESEVSFEDQAKELETEYSELVQINADQSDLGGPAGGGKPAVVDQKKVDEVVDRMKI
jgi:hypothetical protein